MKLSGSLPDSNKLFSILSVGVLILSVLLVVFVAITRLTGGNATIYDDAFMFVRYANNIMEHGVYGWNFDEHSYGCTSVLYTFWVLLWHTIFEIGIEQAQPLLMLSSLGFSFVGIYLFFRILALLFPNSEHPWIWLLLLTASFPFLGNSLNGMDTTLAFLALTSMLFIWLRHSLTDHKSSVLLLGFISYLPFLVRPDTGIYVLMFPALWMITQKEFRLIFRVYLVIGILLGADTLIKWWVFGDPLPLPSYSKSQDYLVGYLGMNMWQVDKFWLYFLATGILPLLTALLFSNGKGLLKAIPFLLPMMITLLILTTKIQIMGSHIRFFYPSFPFLFLSGLILLKDLEVKENVKWVILLWSGCAFGGIFLSEYYEGRIEEEEAEVYRLTDPDIDLTQIYSNDLFFSLLELLPDGATVTGSEHGRLSVLFPKLKILDLVGLHDEQIAHQGYTDEYLAEVSPEIIWLAHDHYIGLNHDIIQGKYFQEAYDFFPGVAYYGLAIRKDLPNFGQLKSMIVPPPTDANTSQ